MQVEDSKNVKGDSVASSTALFSIESKFSFFFFFFSFSGACRLLLKVLFHCFPWKQGSNAEMQMPV